MKPLLALLAGGAALREEDAELAFEIIMSGGASPAQIGAFLMGLRVRGETVTEITAAAKVLRAKAETIAAPVGTIDTCGTGGDASGTYNISTAVALVIAGCDVPVAKHGNKAISSKSGSADILSALGVNVLADGSILHQCLWENHLCFLNAPRHHAAMRHVAQTRDELGLRTLFNLLGPLANPAGAKRQLVGVFAEHWIAPMAEVLGRLGAERAWVVHGGDGLDELTVTGPSQVAEWHNGTVRTFAVSPEMAGLPLAKSAALKGGDAAYNAEALLGLLAGEPGAYRDIVLLNSAAALIIAEKVSDLKSGAAMAARAIDDGSAKKRLDRLIQITNQESLA
jgi:anthranilate phosphoribosyltransferase